MSREEAGVKQYDRIRRYLSLIYRFGFFSREDFQHLVPEGTENYDACLRIIKEIYPEMQAGGRRGARKYPAVDRTKQPGDSDRIADTFFLARLSEEELLGVFDILRELHRQPERAFTLAQSISDGKSVSTFRRRISELEHFGYLVKDSGGRLRPREIILQKKNISDGELTALYRYVRFCGNVTYPRVPARFLLRSIEREMLRRGLPSPKKQLFQFVNSPNHSALDEEIAFELLDAIQNRQSITVTLAGPQPKEISLLPVCLRVDRRLGRWYLLAAENGEPIMLRLSTIRRLEETKLTTAAEWEQAREQVAAHFRQSGFSTHRLNAEPSTVHVQLCFGEEKRLQRQFLREVRFGSIRTTSKGAEYYVQINDPLETIPLLRRYAPWLRPTGEIAETLRQSLMEMQRALEQEELQ